MHVTQFHSKKMTAVNYNRRIDHDLIYIDHDGVGIEIYYNGILLWGMMMKEAELQAKIINKLKTNTFFNLIKNKEKISDVLEKHSNEEVLPYFSVDYLLRLNYYKGCKIVLEGLISKDDDNELVILNGEFIQNISLEKKQQLYPDLLLYNKSNGKYIVGEIKRSREAERQAVTELLGYELEIKNHLPLTSNSEILMILISFDYSTLLQHSIESLILDHKPIICLLPVMTNGEFEHFDIFCPDCWTNTNYALLDEKAFQGTTYSINNKYNNEYGDKSIEELIDISETAIEYIRGNCEKYKQHGFSLMWISNDPSQVCVFITIFLINPYYLFYNSSNRIIKNPLVDNINDNLDQLHRMNYSVTDFVFSDARNYLHNDVDSHLEYGIDLHSFRRDIMHKGNILQCNCWGELGEAIRMAFINKNIRKTINPRYINFNEPILFFKLFDLITENFIFGSGFNNLYDFFQFGVKIGSISNLCLYFSELNLNEDGLPEDENNDIIIKLIPLIAELKNKILWDFYKLENTLQEIHIRYGLDGGAKRFDITSNKDYKNLSDFLIRFMFDFGKHINESCKSIMDIGYQNGAFFDDYFWNLTRANKDQKVFFEASIINDVYPIFENFLWGLINVKEISIESELFHVLLDLSNAFGISITEGREGAHQLCENFSTVSPEKFNKIMSNLQDELKISLTKTYLTCVLKQCKSFDQQKKHIPVIDLIKKFDVEFLIKCIEKANQENRNEVFIHIKDNNSIAIAHAAEGSVLEKTMSFTPIGKIAVHSEYNGMEITEFIELQELYNLAI